MLRTVETLPNKNLGFWAYNLILAGYELGHGGKEKNNGNYDRVEI